MLSSKYAQKQHSFAKKSISRLSSADTTQTMHSLIDSGTGGASFASEQSSGERDRHHLEQVLNDAIVRFIVCILSLCSVLLLFLYFDIDLSLALFPLTIVVAGLMNIFCGNS